MLVAPRPRPARPPRPPRPVVFIVAVPSAECLSAGPGRASPEYREQRPRAPSQGAMERPAPPGRTALPDPAHALSLLRGLSQLRAERKFLDVTLEAAGGRDFRRTAPLAAASPYFRAMFAGQLREPRRAGACTACRPTCCSCCSTSATRAAWR